MVWTIHWKVQIDSCTFLDRWDPGTGGHAESERGSACQNSGPTEPLEPWTWGTRDSGETAAGDFASELRKDSGLGKWDRYKERTGGWDVGETETSLTHWDRVMHICVSKLSIIVIIWTNAGISLIWPLVTSFSEILIRIHTFSFKKTRLKMSSGNWQPFCLGLKVLNNKSLCIVEYGRETESNTSTSWELQYRKWHLNSSVNKQDACPWLRMLA